MSIRIQPLPNDWHRRARRALVVGAAVLAGLGLVPPGAQAQQGQDAVRQYIERTGELLTWAEGLVRETESEPARRVLSQAAELHERSVDMFERGRMAESLAVSRRTRDAVWHAVRVARESMALDERIRIRAERFTDEYQALAERVREAGNEPALRFLERARQQAERAREQYQQGDFKFAWKLLEQAEDLLQRAARLLADGVGPQRLGVELERAREAVDQARDRLGAAAAPRQRALLAEAEEALQRAGQARDEGHPGRALQMAGLATSLAQRATTAGSTAPDEDAVQRQLERFDARAGRIGEQVRDSGSTPARERFEQARRQRDRAAEDHRAGDQERALRQIRAAHDLLNQVEDLIR